MYYKGKLIYMENDISKQKLQILICIDRNFVSLLSTSICRFNKNNKDISQIYFDIYLRRFYIFCVLNRFHKKILQKIYGKFLW